MEVIKYKLTDVCDFQGGSQPPKIEWSKNKQDGYIRMLQIRDFTQREKDNVEYVNDSNRLKKCKKDDVLIGRYGASIGKILTGLEGAYNVAIMKTIPNEKLLDKKYLLALLRGPIFQKFIQNIGGRAAQAGFNKEDLSKYTISLPSIDNQKRIAYVLSDCQILVKKRKESVILLDELLKSTFLEMFGDPVINEKGWTKFSLDKITTKIGSGSTPRGGKDSYKDDGISLIRSLNIHDNKFLYKKLAFIDNEQALKLKNVIVEPNDVLFNITGASVCRSTIVPNDVLPARVNQHVAILRTLSQSLNHIYLNHLLISENFKKYLYKIAIVGGATREAITKDQLQKLIIPVPTISIQNKFAQIVEKVETIKQSYHIHLQELENLYGSISQKAFKGELDLSKVVLENEKKKNIDVSPFTNLKKTNSKYKVIDSIPLVVDEMKGSSSGSTDFQDFIFEDVSSELRNVDDDVKVDTIINLKKWGDYSNQKLSELIKKRFKDNHFSIEMLFKYFYKIIGVRPSYFTSEILKKKPYLNNQQDLKKFVFSSIHRDEKKSNPYLNLKQQFYNAQTENFDLKLLTTDYEFFKEKDKNQRSGIYFSIIE